MEIQQGVIPATKLYAEPNGLEAPELLFIESIIDRSRLHQFKIKPHRHRGLHQLFFLTHGDGKARLDTQEVSLKAPCILLVSEMSVHDFDWQSNIEGYILTISTSLCQKLAAQIESISALFHSTRLYSPQDNLAIQKQLFQQLFHEFQQQKIGRNDALETLLSLILIELVRSEQQVEHGTKGIDKRTHYLHQFTQLIEQHYQTQQPVSLYAKALNITPTHLNTLCRELTSRSALALVHERLLLELKRNLLYSDSTISEIAWALNFSEPAYFSRFFKRMTGVSPREFRNQFGRIEYIGN